MRQLLLITLLSALCACNSANSNTAIYGEVIGGIEHTDHH